jgi:hypothetical protein
MNPEAVAELENAVVLRILSEATVDLQEQLPSEERKVLRTVDEACQSVERLLALGGVSHAEVSVAKFADPGIARALLACMLTDPQTRPVVEPLIAQPPADTQKTVELAFAGAVIFCPHCLAPNHHRYPPHPQGWQK